MSNRSNVHDARKVSYEERFSPHGSLAKAVEIAAVTPTTDTEKPGNHHCWSISNPMRVETAPEHKI
jgi:hypothetical protein